MIFYDVTKMSGARQKSGLARVSARLLAELGGHACPVVWREGAFRRADRPGEAVPFRAGDWMLTTELFSEAERPGFRGFVAASPCRLTAVFHDAIPLRYPHITWPQSVQRHPDYMKLLAGFDRVLAVSEASRRDLLEFWRWQGVAPKTRTGTLGLGADFDGSPRAAAAPALPVRPSLLCVGILEPRKNQVFLLEVCESLWREGVDFDLHFVGRVNPHFGPPVEKRLKMTARKERRLHLHAAAGDSRLRDLYVAASAVVFPTIAEGCGLPLLESLWLGVPCVCSDLPVLRENADGGGCVVAKLNDPADWKLKLRDVLGDAGRQGGLRGEAVSRSLPTWRLAAQTLRATLD